MGAGVSAGPLNGEAVAAHVAKIGAPYGPVAASIREHSVDEPLPGCLEYLLTEHILKYAHRDALKDVLEAMKVDESTGELRSEKGPQQLFLGEYDAVEAGV